MASIIRIKRSSGTNKPASLNWGEMAYVTGVGQYGGTNQYKDRIFLGDDGTNVHPVGGHYYTSMMEHTPGGIAGVTNTRNSDGGIVAILDSNRKVDEWNVDNLTLDGNTLSSSDTNGDIILNPNGGGDIVIPDNTLLGFGGGANGTALPDAAISYDESGTDELTFDGANVRFKSNKVTVDGQLVVAGSNATLGQVQIASNSIQTLGGTTKLFIDPFPDGLSNEGDVIIKGNLQVDGTTTTVNSTQATVNDPILSVGDATSSRTVMSTVNAGASSVVVDSIIGINVNDTIQHAGLSLSGITTVTAINSGSKTLTFQGVTIAGIATGQQLTVTHAIDTNTDRGLSFTYNVGVGTANSKEGFFGFDDSSIADSVVTPTTHGTHADDSRRWTYVPNATISNSVVTGTKGFLDVKGIYYQSGDFNTGGVVWFDASGLQRTTNDPQTPVSTSKQILTAITKNTLLLSVAINAAAGDIIKQDSTGAFGVVETGVSGSTTVNLIGVEGTFNTTDNLRKEGNSGAIQNLSSVPNTVTVVYTNKPHWTSTLDGGTF